MKSLLFTALFIVFSFVCFAQKSIPDRPRLVVVVMVDELNADQLFTWQKKFEKGGIARMMNQGAFFPHVMVNTSSAYLGSSVASFYSGATPAVHGVVSSRWEDRFTGAQTTALYGNRKLDVADSLLVPNCETMLASTIADELRRLYPKYSKIRGVGMSPDILNWAVGHGNEGFYTIDVKTGLMVNRSLPVLPFWVKEFNAKKFADVYKVREWGPINNINDYYESRFRKETLSTNFLYPFVNEPNYTKLIYSPFGNVMIRDFAASLIINEGLGKDDIPDMLTLSFSMKPAINKNCKPMDAEVEDMALRLDHEMTGLIGLFEETVGLENTLIVFTGAHNPGVFPDEYLSTGTLSGTFSGKKAMSLLNLYFMAQYGQAKWVTSYHDGIFYLNTKVIVEKSMNLAEMRTKASEFLLQMAGVSRTYTYDELLYETRRATNEVLHQTFNPKRTGDVAIELQPGWIEELEDGELRTRPSKNRDLPLILFGGGIPNRYIQSPIQLIDVAPTISTILQISYPNGNSGSPIKELFAK